MLTDLNNIRQDNGKFVLLLLLQGNVNYFLLLLQGDVNYFQMSCVEQHFVCRGEGKRRQKKYFFGVHNEGIIHL